jgi:hypothetical protein
VNLAAYQAMCNRHHQIDDFRGKLLALLPIASGAAGLLLLSKSDTVEKYLTPIGIFGLAVTFGLFLYELHGISVCKQIIKQAGTFEDKLNVPEALGLFRDRKPNLVQRLFEPEMASWVVYLSVLAGWFYVAGARGWWDHTSPRYIGSPTWIIVVVGGVLLVKWLTVAFPKSWWQNIRSQRPNKQQAPAANGIPPSGDRTQGTAMTMQTTSAMETGRSAHGVNGTRDE